MTNCIIGYPDKKNSVFFLTVTGKFQFIAVYPSCSFLCNTNFYREVHLRAEERQETLHVEKWP
jgi:hypothetical protein